jgi:hypothetical protein
MARPVTPAPLTLLAVSAAPAAGASGVSAGRCARGREIERLRHGDDAGELVGAIVGRHRRHLDELGAFAGRCRRHAVARRRHRRRRLRDANQRHQPPVLEALQDLDALARRRRERQLASAQIAHRRRVGRQRAQKRPHLR